MDRFCHIRAFLSAVAASVQSCFLLSDFSRLKCVQWPGIDSVPLLGEGALPPPRGRGHCWWPWLVGHERSLLWAYLGQVGERWERWGQHRDSRGSADCSCYMWSSLGSRADELSLWKVYLGSTQGWPWGRGGVRCPSPMEAWWLGPLSVLPWGGVMGGWLGAPTWVWVALGREGDPRCGQLFRGGRSQATRSRGPLPAAFPEAVSVPFNPERDQGGRPLRCFWMGSSWVTYLSVVRQLCVHVCENICEKVCECMCVSTCVCNPASNEDAQECEVVVYTRAEHVCI